MESKQIDTSKIIDSYAQKIDSQSDSIHTVLDAGGAITNHLYDAYSKHYIAEGAQFTKEDVVLDFGCGLGRLTEYFAPKVNSIIGVDISPQLIEIANQRNKLSNCSYKTILSGEAIEGEFTKIIFFGVFLHLDDETLKSTVANFSRILKRGGKLVFIEPVYDKDFQLNDQVIYRTPETLFPFFESNGFVQLDIKNVIRIPSYSFHLIKKVKNTSPWFLSVCRNIESLTINRKPEHVQLYWKRFIFQKK